MVRRSVRIEQRAASVQGAIVAAATVFILSAIAVAAHTRIGFGMLMSILFVAMLCVPLVVIFRNIMDARESRPTVRERLIEACGLGVLLGLAIGIFGWPMFGATTLYAALILPISLSIGYAVRFRRGTLPPLPGRCRTCDYDLSYNESGACPECGTVFKNQNPTG